MNLNYMDDIFSYKKPDKTADCEGEKQTDNNTVGDDDLYAILGCHPEATTDQINAEYRVRVRELHPDKCGTTSCTSSAESAEKKCAIDSKFCKLQRAKEILGDEKRRRDYDRWRQSGLHISYRKWCQLNESGGLHNSIHWFGSAGGRPCKPALCMPNQVDISETDTNATSSNSNGNWNSQPISSPTETQFTTGDQHWSSEKETSLLKQFRNYEI